MAKHQADFSDYMDRGDFSTVINFLLMALVLFIIVKAMNTIREKNKKEEEEEPKEDSDEVKLLKEIRDELKKEKK